MVFRRGRFKLHSGLPSDWKIEAEGLDDEDWATLAMLGARVVGKFDCVTGIPTGGLRFEEEIASYISDEDGAPCLIVDDVLTTGASMEQARERLLSDAKPGTKVVGLVAFARGPCPPWVKAIFTYTGEAP